MERIAKNGNLKDRILYQVKLITYVNQSSEFMVNDLCKGLGVSENPKSPDWLAFYQELGICIKNRLFDFTDNYSRSNFFNNYEKSGGSDINFYLNNLFDKKLVVITWGEMMLSQISLQVGLENLENSVKHLDKRILWTSIAIIMISAVTAIVTILFEIFHF